MEGISDTKDKVMGFIDSHPRILLIVVVALIVVMITFYLYSNGYINKSNFKGRKLGKQSADSPGEDELDRLIDSIHEKQKRGKK